MFTISTMCISANDRPPTIQVGLHLTKLCYVYGSLNSRRPGFRSIYYNWTGLKGVQRNFWNPPGSTTDFALFIIIWIYVQSKPIYVYYYKYSGDICIEGKCYIIIIVQALVTCLIYISGRPLVPVLQLLYVLALYL